MTKVLNKHFDVITEEDVYIGRGSIYGNPYSHLENTKATFKVATREEAVKKYEEYLLSTPNLYAKLRDLVGKNLVCYCNSNPCHGHIIKKYVDKLGTRTWSRKHPNGYEVSSKGDKRFSAFYAILSDGLSIEYHYQVNIKGYSSIKEGKGKPPKYKISKEDLYSKYLDLWSRYLKENKGLILELAMNSIDKPLTDMFASSDINQARALTELMNKLLI